MIAELSRMYLTGEQQKEQTYEIPQFLCSAYYTDWQKSAVEGVPWHWHKELEFMTVVEGKVQAGLGAMTMELSKGDGFFCNAKTLHWITMKNCERCRVHSLVFDSLLISGGVGTIYDEKFLRPLLRTTDFPGMFLFADQDSHKVITEEITAAHGACEKEPEGYELEVRYHLSRALLKLVNERKKLIPRIEKHSIKMERTRMMLDYIREHYEEPLTAKEIAAAANICERECQRCFQEILHQSPMSYLQQFRIQVAAGMLADFDRSILQVGIAVGFSNPSHFSRIFRSYFHCTPKEYRKKAVTFEAFATK